MSVTYVREPDGTLLRMVRSATVAAQENPCVCACGYRWSLLIPTPDRGGQWRLKHAKKTLCAACASTRSEP